MSESNRRPLSLAASRAQARADRPASREDASIILRAVADDVASSLNLICDESVVAAGENIQLFSLDAATNVLRPVTDESLGLEIYIRNPALLSRDRGEVLKFIYLTVKQARTVSFENACSVALLDEPEKMCFNRLPYTKEQARLATLDNYPGYKHLLSLIEDDVERRSLTLFIGSLLDSGSSRSQYLHWKSGGGDGKSSIVAAVESVLGKRFVVRTRANDVSTDHWGDALIGARLLVFADANETQFFSSGKFKELTGEPSTTINPKGKPHKKIDLTHKVIVLSNNSVSITGQMAETRRLISVTSKPDELGELPNHKWWFDEVRDNGEAFVLYCYGEYLRATEADSRVRTAIPSSELAIQAAFEERYSELIEVLESKYEFTNDSADFIKRAEMNKFILSHLDNYPQIDRKSIKKGLENVIKFKTGGLDQGKRTGKHGYIYRGIREIPKPKAGAASAAT